MTSFLTCLKKYLNGRYYTEVKDKRYSIHLNESLILRE